MTTAIKINHCNQIPLSLTSLCTCNSRLSSQTLAFPRFPSKLNLKLVVDGRNSSFVQSYRNRRFCIGTNDQILKTVGELEPDHLDQEVGNGHDAVKPPSEAPGSQLKKRVVFGLAMGIAVGGVVLAGGWVFTVALAAAVFVGAREYFELVRSRGIAEGMTPPPRYVSRVCYVICALMPILTLYFGHIDVSVTSAAFVVAMALLLQRGNPRFSQLSSAIFGLFYCGYLPCFWVKLRCGLAAPALNSNIGAAWPVLLGGRTHWTVGLIATLISFSSIISADTFAFLGGKTFGRTPLTSISPKKTWEGAIAGLSGCVATAITLSKLFCWPTSLISAAAFGCLNFAGSLFGDLLESMIKRDAGVKDSGSLIPGHGCYSEMDISKKEGKECTLPHHPYAFHVCGPRKVSSPNWRDLISSSWKDGNYRRTVVACFVQGVYLLELDRQVNKTEVTALAPNWWKPFKYKLIETLVDQRDGSIFGALLEWDRSAAMADLILMKPSGAPRAVLALRGTLLTSGTIWRDIEDDLRFVAWESLDGSARFSEALKYLKSALEKYGINDICIAGHSLGAGFALQVGKELAKQGIFVETHLFNPPSVSLAMILRTLAEKATRFWKRLKSMFLLSFFSRPRGCGKWAPHLYVNNSDYICCYYNEPAQTTADCNPMTIDESQNISANVAAKIFVMSKGKQKFLEAHGLNQWWSDDLELELALHNSKLISIQLASL